MKVTIYQLSSCLMLTNRFLCCTYQQNTHTAHNTPPQVIAYPFHCNRLPPSIAYHSLPQSHTIPLSHLPFEVEVSAASCAFGHCLFLTSYIPSLNVICDVAYSDKVSISYKKCLAATSNMLVLVPISLPSTPVAVDSHLFSFSNPHPRTLRIPNQKTQSQIPL